MPELHNLIFTEMGSLRIFSKIFCFKDIKQIKSILNEKNRSYLFQSTIVYIRKIVWFIICSYYYLYTCSSWGLACICWWWVWQSFYFSFTHSKQIWFRNTLIFNFGLFRNTFDKLLNFFRNTTVKMNCSVHWILFHLI